MLDYLKRLFRPSSAAPYDPSAKKTQEPSAKVLPNRMMLEPQHLDDVVVRAPDDCKVDIRGIPREEQEMFSRTSVRRAVQFVVQVYDDLGFQYMTRLLCPSAKPVAEESKPAPDKTLAPYLYAVSGNVMVLYKKLA